MNINTGCSGVEQAILCEFLYVKIFSLFLHTPAFVIFTAHSFKPEAPGVVKQSQNQIPLQVILPLSVTALLLVLLVLSTHLEVQVLVLTLVLMPTLTLWLVTELGLVVAFVSAMV